MRRLTVVLASLPLAIGATAAAACTVDTTPVAFGIVDVTRTTESNGEIAVSCSISTDVEVRLTGGSGPGQRAMIGSGGARLSYELFTDATRNEAWGDGFGNGAPLRLTNVREETQRRQIYGEVPRQDPVPPGDYSDSLTVEVIF